MNRRRFFSRLSKAVAGAVLVAHLDFGSLIPMPEKFQVFEPEPYPLSQDWDEFMVRTVACAFAVPEKFLRGNKQWGC